MIKYLYRRTSTDWWEVGYFEGDGDWWFTMAHCHSQQVAIELVRKLNGGKE